MAEALERELERRVEALGYELVELERAGSRARPILRIRIDREDSTPQAGVTVDECARVSRALEAWLDEDQAVAERYVLEVSSPGVERPLKRPSDWRRFVGRKAKVLSPRLGGRVEIEIVGLEGEPGEETAVVRDARGAEHQLPLADIKEARLAFHW
jgi:ribosome maturation factor RimP